MKRLFNLSALLVLASVFSMSSSYGQSCDTLRNYDPVGGFTPYNYGNGLYLGHMHVEDNGTPPEVYKADAFVESYSVSTPTEIRAVRIAPWKAQANSGPGAKLTINVYENNGGFPGNIINSEEVLYSDLNVTYWNTIEFTTPTSVSSNFFVGYALDYTTPVDSFAVYDAVPLASSAPTLMHIVGTGPMNGVWIDLDDHAGATSLALDVLLSNGTVPDPNMTGDNISACLSGAFVNLDASGTTGDVDVYEWWLTDNPTTQIYTDAYGVNATLNPTTATPSSQRIYLWADGACVTRGVYAEVTVHPDVTATITPTDASCGATDGSIAITNPAGGTTPYLYSIDGGTTTSSTGTFNNLAAGTYDVEVSTTGNGCVFSQQVTIADLPGEIITVGSGATICPGGTANLTASGNGTIEWFDGTTSVGTGTTYSATPTSTTTYDVVLTDANGCTDTKQVTVTIDNLDDASFVYVSNTLCLGGTNESPTITGVQGGVFSASGTGLTIDATSGEIDLNTSTNGTYDVTYTTNGTCPNTETVSITVTDSPDASFTYANTEYCSDEGVITPDFGSNGSAGTFSSTPGLSITAGTGSINLGASTAGTYTITNTIAASGSCPASSATFDVTIKATPTVDAGQDEAICEGESVTLTASASAGTVTWDNGVTDGQAFTPTATNTYTVTADNSGCTATDNVTITVNPLPTVSAGQDQTVCVDNAAITLTGTPTGGTFTGTGVTNNEFDPATADVGTHTITYTYTDANGCENSATMEIEVDGCASISVNELNNQFVLSPNPSSDFIDVKVLGNNKMNSVQLISLEGKVVNTNTTVLDSQVTRVDVSSLSKGTYLIQLSTDNGSITKKIVVQ